MNTRVFNDSLGDGAEYPQKFLVEDLSTTGFSLEQRPSPNNYHQSQRMNGSPSDPVFGMLFIS